MASPCKGIDNVKLATLLSLRRSGSPDAEYDTCLDAVREMTGSEEGPWVFAVASEHLRSLAEIAALEDDEFDALTNAWGATEEFEGWERAEVSAVLREIGDLAETANLHRKVLMLWVSP